MYQNALWYSLGSDSHTGHICGYLQIIGSVPLKQNEQSFSGSLVSYVFLRSAGKIVWAFLSCKQESET